MTTESNQVPIGKLIFSILNILMFPALILLLSGDWFWVEGWMFEIWLITLSVSVIIYLYQKDPTLLAERLRKPGTGNQKRWDRNLLYVLTIMILAWFVIMPLDAKRYEWTTNFPFWLKLIGGIGLLKSFFFQYHSYIDNTFLSPLVRIQTERKQQVVSTGVYGLVRHPLYLGLVLLFLGTPLLLSSKYGILIGVLMSLFLIARIFGEEEMLVKN